MAATLDDNVSDLQRANEELQRRLDEVIAERDEVIAERDEALDHQTATAEVLRVINASPGELASVFDAILDKATKVVRRSIRDPAHHRWGAQAHRRPSRCLADLSEFLTGRPHEFSKTGWLISQLLRGERFIHHDVTESEGYRSGAPIARALVELEGARTVLSVPLSKDDALLGLFNFYRREVRPFTDKQIALLQSFAAQAVIAMENARLITETREALEQQTATAEVLQVINSSPGDLAPVFDAILRRRYIFARLLSA